MDQEAATKKFAEINSAYEVLSKPGKSSWCLTVVDLRQRYDNGDDPNNPQGGQQGHPFAQGFPGGGFPQGFPGGGGGGGGPFMFQQGGQGQNVKFEFHF